MQLDNIVFWSYIILLLIGGLIGFFRAGSKVSLITSAVAAALLILTRLHGIFQPAFGRNLSTVIMALLLVVFAMAAAMRHAPDSAAERLRCLENGVGMLRSPTSSGPI